ncbi:hypothetical protein ACFV9W_31435 [Streptomyces sp. NPDC059897]|uniref:hypothetical protein n=1 Tax=Streptomyces sp. NPDC059897 TaxID=3346994 RepID=UPI0036585464
MSAPPGGPGPATGYGYGSSLLLEDGDLVLSGGTLAQVHEMANLRQALSLRLLTPYGTDRVHSTYGLDVRGAFTEGHGRRTVREVVRLEVVRTLATDPRVREVMSVLFNDDPEFVAQVRAAGGRPAGRHDRSRRLVVEVATVSDTTVTLEVEL